jgi:integration host factor subunit beta
MPKPVKKNFSELVAKRIGKDSKEASELLKGLADDIMEELASGNAVSWQNMFSLRLAQKPTRMKQNPRTGKKVIIPPSRSMRIKIGKQLKLDLNSMVLAKNVVLISKNAGQWDKIKERLAGQRVLWTNIGSIEELEKQEPVHAHLVILDFMPDSDEYDRLMEAIKLGNKFFSARVLGVISDGHGLNGFEAAKIMCDEWVRIPFDEAEPENTIMNELARFEEENIFFKSRMALKSPSDHPNIEKALEMISRLVERLRFPEEKHAELVSAVTEAVDNSARHGNNGEKGKFLLIEMIVDSQRFICHLHDEGKGFDYEKHLKNVVDMESALKTSNQQTPTKHKGGGLGILLMRRIMDELIYTPPGNRLSLVKYFKGKKK